MIALAVDDERLMLDTLTKAVSASPDIESVYEFTSCTAALEWVSNTPVDIAFLDISMRGMSGMGLAEHIQAICPECKIIFCTGFPEYAVDAFKIHVSGYLMKPITVEAVQKEIDHIKNGNNRKKPLTVQCFGTFDVFAGGEPLPFRRTKTKELLAYLVDRNGAGVTAKQICAVLWENDMNDSKNMNYFWQLLDDLRHTLSSVKAETVLLKVGSCYAINTDQIDCDYYQHLKTGRPTYYGEYMTQYSWAESTAAYLR